MQTVDTSIWGILGVSKQEDLFFKIYPDLVKSVSAVRMEKVDCPSCKRPSREAWMYQQDGEWQQENVWPICNDCEKLAYAEKLGRQLKTKHMDVIDNDWYFISDSDSSGFKDFEEINQSTTAAKLKATGFAKTLLAGEIRNLRLSGTPGTGKTHLAKAIARTLKHGGKRVAFIESAKLFDKIKKNFGNDYEQNRFDEHFKNFDLVVIDDVGLETVKTSDVSWTSREWVRLVDMRKDKATVYTTNFDTAALTGVIGARAESRMCENSEFIEIFTPGEDYRRKLFY